ncbi:DNA-directed RNA polymerase subunit beta [Candidatus Liberibacter americanus]|uniref:DNA-directed RNA polymerase subunit beta n=2 Tax=Candidatus Liberibacter americanus TaxID=309868 RepID=U6B4J9_9HYPH|nr:DNA-directed RNA polymerase subunit beta [Candidatus Liberibacter americanus]AHA27820.1 DNA-directed RNA polymerase beta subunit [Candidatus Liberibacter americanus str. Sao Paulo]EMS35987.1 DNA-directed RNA polymerase subunit beta [Candidatus Liberibacter americanus PW_SP]
MAKGIVFNGLGRERKFFGRIPEIIDIPDLVEVQRASYDKFLMIDHPSDSRPNEGLQDAFRSVFPVTAFSGAAMLEFVSYEFEPPKFDVEDCLRRNLTYSAPLKIILRLIVFDIDEFTGAKSIKDIKEQSVYMGDIPLMTEDGTFVINGTPRVVVSQVHRSPGILFDHDKGRASLSGKLLYACRIIPNMGLWLDIEFDTKDIIHMRVDRRRKIPVTSFLMALGMDHEEILSTFYSKVSYTKKGDYWSFPLSSAEIMIGSKLSYNLIDINTGEVVVDSGRKLSPLLFKGFKDKGIECLGIERDALYGFYVAEDIVNTETGEIYLEAGNEIDEDSLDKIISAGIYDIPTLYVDSASSNAYLRNTLAADKNENRQDALLDIYRVMRPGDVPTVSAAESMFNYLFSDPDKYDLSAVGRVKMNMRLNLDAPDTVRHIRKEDAIAIIKVLIDLRDGKGKIDDIDNLGNRRVRSVGEMLKNQYRLGLLRMERSIKERISLVDIDTVMPQDLINAKPVVSAVRDFFCSSQLSQLEEHVNSLSRITHTRRLSALGQGGITRARAGFEVRDVHPTHYGRICPAETSEGHNIGLVSSLASFARVNEYGFIETPYRKVEDGRVTNEVVYLSASEEENCYIAQANSAINEDGLFVDDLVFCRCAGEEVLVPQKNIHFIDASPKQVVSIAASLIPFLENDDSNRVLMGCNMQRQAVPLLKAEAPFVGTGMEQIVAKSSGAAIVAKHAGIVEQVDAMRIVIRVVEENLDPSDSGVDIYRLTKFQRSNQNTCVNQRPLVKVGDTVRKNDIIADGPSTDSGDLALGRNIVVAFMPWRGYNFEDSMLVSERMVSDDVFTSIHIGEFEVMARDTKLGPEEITRDIPNISEEGLKNIDECGVICVGAEINPGDILVGKITPKSESPMTPEEKLLRAIFGEKASDVRDTSLRVPPGISGTVVDVRIFNRHGIEKSERSLSVEREQIEILDRDRDDEQAILDRNTYSRLMEFLCGQTIVSGPKGFKKNTVLSSDLMTEYPRSQWWMFAVKDEKVQRNIESLKARYDSSKSVLENRFKNKVEKIKWGDDMPPGVLRVVKIFVAMKRKLQPGDKMAGRHGNKGIVSRILPCEDMPFLEDGTPVDIVLNPLGVPSRMNVGQIFETHLGWACVGLGKKIKSLINDYKANGDILPLRTFVQNIVGKGSQYDKLSQYDDKSVLSFADQWKSGVFVSTPVFDGASEDDISFMIGMAGLDKSGQSILYDGLTGEKFDRPVTVGYIYMLKLNHMVDDKIHARSIGSYSLVSQQPVGRKSLCGGQRLGEMEVACIQAYGAAYILQEMLTIKSDDIVGRTKVYESIVSGDHSFETGVPESFNVLIKEIQGLGLSIDLENSRVVNNVNMEEIPDLSK